MESQHFIKAFYANFGATLTDQKEGEWEVKLTPELDKALMNRPYYWHYIERMNREGEPMSLTYALKDERGKLFVHPGSPHLHKLYDYTISKARRTILYEKVNGQTESAALHPWLFSTFTIRYEGITSTTECVNIGIHLLSGTYKWNLLPSLRKFDWNQEPSYYTYPIRPLIPVNSAVTRVTSYLEAYIRQEQHEWAERALEKFETEAAIIREFQRKEDLDEDWYNKHYDDLATRFQPAIRISEENRGVFHFSEQSHRLLLKR